MDKDKKHTSRLHFRRPLIAALAVVLTLALTLTALAAAGIFTLERRSAEPGETFLLRLEEQPDIVWENAKLVFTLDGPESCEKIHFLPGWLPAPVNDTYPEDRDSDGWYTALTTENKVGQPCQIEVFYAPEFINDGHLILLIDEVEEVSDESWEEYQITKIRTVRTIPAIGRRPELHMHGGYVLLYHQSEGYLIVVSGHSSLEDLERAAKELQIEHTGEILSAADYEGENRFIDYGAG